MKRTLCIMACVVLTTGVCIADDTRQGFEKSWTNQDTYVRPYQQNAYGPGVHSDATGRAFQLEDRQGRRSHSDQVRPNAYGLGVGMDQFGRPVRPGRHRD